MLWGETVFRLEDVDRDPVPEIIFPVWESLSETLQASGTLLLHWPWPLTSLRRRYNLNEIPMTGSMMDQTYLIWNQCLTKFLTICNFPNVTTWKILNLIFFFLLLFNLKTVPRTTTKYWEATKSETHRRPTWKIVFDAAPSIDGIWVDMITRVNQTGIEREWTVSI